MENQESNRTSGQGRIIRMQSIIVGWEDCRRRHRSSAFNEGRSIYKMNQAIVSISLRANNNNNIAAITVFLLNHCNRKIVGECLGILAQPFSATQPAVSQSRF